MSNAKPIAAIDADQPLGTASVAGSWVMLRVRLLVLHGGSGFEPVLKFTVRWFRSISSRERAWSSARRRRTRRASSRAISGSAARSSSPIPGIRRGRPRRRRARVASTAAGIEAYSRSTSFGVNPDSAMVAAGAARSPVRSNVDSIIGLGGGSSLDCAKGINFLLTNGGDDGATTAATARPRRRCCR